MIGAIYTSVVPFSSIHVIFIWNKKKSLQQTEWKANSDEDSRCMSTIRDQVAHDCDQNLNNVSMTMSLSAEPTGGRSLVIGLR